jgi:hypothetical protein
MTRIHRTATAATMAIIFPLTMTTARGGVGDVARREGGG